jgi:hypothetical protein
LLGAYLVITAAVVVAAAPKAARWRGGFLGASIFGVAYLVCVLKGGFDLETIYDSQRLVRTVKLGLALLPIAFLLSQLGAMLAWPSPGGRQGGE